LARMPNLFSFLPPRNPGVPRSTMKAVELFFDRGSPVRVITTAISPLMPCVIQFFVPLITHSLPSFFATHFILPASLPVLGSVRPHAASHSPDASRGKYFFFCASLPKARICPVPRELCAARLRPTEPHTLAISWMISTYSK